MKILTEKIEKKIQSKIINHLLKKEYDLAINNISQIIDELYSNIPDNKRISYGRVHTIKVLPYFELAAVSSKWELREYAQMFFRKLIKKYPDEIKEYLLKLVKSDDHNIRRFVSETLRPVCENKWFYDNSDYSLSILKYMFKESSKYPRTSVGNNLSDFARRRPELVYDLVKELVESGDVNSYWIAYRACRNLVKKEPIRVMDLLGVDEYRYKKRVYRWEEFLEE